MAPVVSGKGIRMKNSKYKEAFRLSGFQAFRLSGFQAFRLSGFQAFRLSGFQAFRLSGFQAKYSIISKASNHFRGAEEVILAGSGLFCGVIPVVQTPHIPAHAKVIRAQYPVVPSFTVYPIFHKFSTRPYLCSRQRTGRLKVEAVLTV